ncbi:glycosyltransferase family 39 protein, partial [bacterium]|nr:glycosyltransferase family 39 protein [bacterium]
WLSTLKNLLFLIAFMLSAHGLGRILLEKIFPAARARLDEMLYSLGLGLALISLLIFSLGAAGFYHPVIFAAIFVFLTGAGTWITWKRRARLCPGSGWMLGTWAWSDKILILLVGGFFLLVGMTIITPEIFFDSLVYHLAVPSQWIQAGHIHPIPTNFYSNLPMGIQMLYTGALMLSDERLCRMLHALLGILAGLTTFSLGRRWFGRRAGLWAAGLFLTTPIVIINMLEAAVDVGAAFFAVLAFHVMLAGVLKQEGGKNQQIMAGLLIGAALAGKYTTAFMLMPAVLVVLYIIMRQQGWKGLTGILARISLGAVILMMPWVIKNIIFTNNPIYPFLYNNIPSKYVVPEKMQQAMDQIREYGHRTITQFIRLPWDMTFCLPTSYSYVGPVFLMLFPGVLLLVGYWRRGPPALGAVLITVVFSALIWANRTQISRFYIPSLPLLAILCTYALDRWEQWHKVPALISRWTILALLGWGWANTMAIGISNWDPIGSALGLESRSTYLDRKLMNSYAPMARVVNGLPKNTRILAWGETRSFYFQRPVTAPTVFDHNPLIELLAGSSNTREVWQNLREQGYTHIFIHSGEAVRT